MSVTQPDPSPAPDWAEAFTAICDVHRSRLVRWLTAIFGPRDAEDIAQEALTRLYVRPGLLADTADAWPWLSVVARNVGRDMARHNALSTAVDAHDLADLPGETRVWDQVRARDDADRLARALGCLNAHDRALIRLRDMQGVSIGTIAELLGSNENAVRQQLFRARRKLQQSYVALGGDRQAGLGTLLGLRIRELVRRYAPVFDALGASSAAMFVAGLPAAAALVATVALGHADAAAPATRSARLVTASGRVPAYESHPERRGPAVATGSRGGAAHRTRRILDADQRTGVVGVEAHVYQKPTNGDAGTKDEERITIYDPVFGGYLYSISSKGWKPSDGHGPVCDTGLVPCD